MALLNSLAETHGSGARGWWLTDGQAVMGRFVETHSKARIGGLEEAEVAEVLLRPESRVNRRQVAVQLCLPLAACAQLPRLWAKPLRHIAQDLRCCADVELRFRQRRSEDDVWVQKF